MSNAARTTIVTVCYNSLAVLPAMLSSVPQGVPVVLVDNASADPVALDGLAESAGARVVRSAKNLGFGVGCNLGAAQAVTEFVLFLNPDAALEPGCVAALEAGMDRHPAAAAANPRISDAWGRPYFKRRSALLPRARHMARGWPPTDCDVTVLSGAAIFVRRAAFEQVGGFDPQIFLYHEDDDLSLRLAAQAGPLMFIRDAAIRHIGGSSSERSAEGAAFKAWHMGQSRIYALQKHGRKFPLISSILAAVTQLLSPDIWFSARKRRKRWAFLGGVMGWKRP